MIKKLYKYRRLISSVIFKTAWYGICRFLLPDKLFLREIVMKQRVKTLVSPFILAQPKRQIVGQVDRIINKIAPRASCLTRSLVKRDILRRYGIESSICLGVSRQADGYSAHSWITSEANAGHTLVYKVS